VENAGTSIAIKFKDGVVFAVEKIVNSKLLVPGSNKRIQTIDRHIGVAYSGLLPDGRHFVNRGRDEASQWRSIFKVPIPVSSLANRLGSYAQAYTLYNSVRPFGITTILGGVDDDGTFLYMIEPSGAWWGYKGTATGKGRQVAKSELEKLDLGNLEPRDAVKQAARIIYLAHEDSKDKEFELEMTWVSTSETGGRHVAVPDDLFEEAKNYAVYELSGGDEMEE
jgi:20S proteasome subunit alpha 7